MMLIFHKVSVILLQDDGDADVSKYQLDDEEVDGGKADEAPVKKSSRGSGSSESSSSDSSSSSSSSSSRSRSR